MSESKTQGEIQLAITLTGGRVFRNQTGKYRVCDCPQCRSCRKGRVISSGLAPGSSDLIGWTPVEITQDMVGKKLAVFTAIEVKAETGKPTVQQANFVHAVKNAGGIGMIARSMDEAVEKIKNFMD